MSVPASCRPRKSQLPEPLSLEAPDNKSEIRTVPALYEELRVTVRSAAAVWAWRSSTAMLYRQKLTHQLAVRTEDGHSLQVSEFLLEHLPAFKSFVEKRAKNPLKTQGHQFQGAHRSLVKDVTVNTYFQHILLLVQLRWVARLHAALSELDYRLCSLEKFVTTLHWLAVQQSEEVPTDSGLAARVQPQQLDCRSLLDDLLSLFHRQMGAGYAGFIHFVNSCNPRVVVRKSQLEPGAPALHDNTKIARLLDEVWLCYYLTTPVNPCQLPSVFAELERMEIPPPDILPANVDAIEWWMQATTAASRRDRLRAAQLQATHLTAAIELEKVDGFEQSAADEEDDGGRADLQRKLTALESPLPTLGKRLFDVVIAVVGHHDSFLLGVRLRLRTVLRTQYQLSQNQVSRLRIFESTNLNEPTLSRQKLDEIKERSLAKIRQYGESRGVDVLPYLQPALVGLPREKDNDARYTTVPPRLVPIDELQDRIEQADKNEATSGKDAFKVLKLNAPLVWDPHLRKMKATGYFRDDGKLGV